MAEKKEISLFIALIALFSFVVLLVAGFSIFLAFMFGSGELTLLIIAALIGLFTGWLIFLVSEKIIRMNTTQKILTGIFSPTLTLLAIFIGGFILVKITEQISKVKANAANAGAGGIPDMMPPWNMTTIIVFAVLFYLAFNFFIIKSAIKEGLASELKWYFLSIVLVIILFYLGKLMTSSVLQSGIGS